MAKESKPVTSLANRVADVIERELNSINITGRYPDVRTRVKLLMSAVDIRCLSIICAESVIGDSKDIRVTQRRNKPKGHRVTPRGYTQWIDADDSTKAKEGETKQ